MSSASKAIDGHDGQMPATQKIGEIPLGLNNGGTDYNGDDIHEAALVDNPETVERPSLATFLSILVCSYNRSPPTEPEDELIIDSHSFWARLSSHRSLWASL